MFPIDINTLVAFCVALTVTVCVGVIIWGSRITKIVMELNVSYNLMHKKFIALADVIERQSVVNEQQTKINKHQDEINDTLIEAIEEIIKENER